MQITPYSCFICNYIAPNKSKLLRHCYTKRHIENENLFVNEFIGKTESVNGTPVYICSICNYSTRDKRDFKKHLNTVKHISRLEDIRIKNSINDIKLKTDDDSRCKKSFQCKFCDALYKSRSGLWKHEKSCGKNKNVNNELAVLQNGIDSIVTSVGNTTIVNNTNNFNINVFLNQDCKNAMNINEFIETINVSVEHLDYSRKNGLANSISQLLLKHLQELDITQRPIHCTDTKRETLYIKSNDEWSKDCDKKEIGKCIYEVTNKHEHAIEEWVSANPDWYTDETKQLTYLEICDAIICKKDDIINKKIIKNIVQEIKIDKEQAKQIKY